MHVHDLNPKKTLITVVIFILILIAGFLTLHRPRFTYQLSINQTAQLLKDKTTCFYPYQLPAVINKTNPKVVLIDIRNKFVFSRGHIPGAKNISAYDLTKENNVKYLRSLADKGIDVVLYGKDQLQANGSFMWFRQVGFSNVKFLLGGYDYYKAHEHSLAQTKEDNSYLKGMARFDYTKVASSKAMTVASTHKAKKPVVIRRRKKTAVAAGGC